MFEIVDEKGWRGHQSDRRWRLRRQRCGAHDQQRGRRRRFIAANTDAQVLDRNPAPKRIPLGAELTRVWAPAPSRKSAATPRWNRRWPAGIDRGADMLFITAGMGGGTGTGALPWWRNWPRRWAFWWSPS